MKKTRKHLVLMGFALLCIVVSEIDSYPSKRQIYDIYDSAQYDSVSLSQNNKDDALDLENVAPHSQQLATMPLNIGTKERPKRHLQGLHPRKKHRLKSNQPFNHGENSNQLGSPGLKEENSYSALMDLMNEDRRVLHGEHEPDEKLRELKEMIKLRLAEDSVEHRPKDRELRRLFKKLHSYHRKRMPDVLGVNELREERRGNDEDVNIAKHDLEDLEKEYRKYGGNPDNDGITENHAKNHQLGNHAVRVKIASTPTAIENAHHNPLGQHTKAVNRAKHNLEDLEKDFRRYGGNPDNDGITVNHANNHQLENHAVRVKIASTPAAIENAHHNPLGQHTKAVNSEKHDLQDLEKEFRRYGGNPDNDGITVNHANNHQLGNHAVRVKIASTPIAIGNARHNPLGHHTKAVNRAKHNLEDLKKDLRRYGGNPDNDGINENHAKNHQLGNHAVSVSTAPTFTTTENAHHYPVVHYTATAPTYIPSEKESGSEMPNKGAPNDIQKLNSILRRHKAPAKVVAETLEAVAFPSDTTPSYITTPVNVRTTLGQSVLQRSKQRVGIFFKHTLDKLKGRQPKQDTAEVKQQQRNSVKEKASVTANKAENTLGETTHRFDHNRHRAKRPGSEIPPHGRRGIMQGRDKPDQPSSVNIGQQPLESMQATQGNGISGDSTEQEKKQNKHDFSELNAILARNHVPNKLATKALETVAFPEKDTPPRALRGPVDFSSANEPHADITEADDAEQSLESAGPKSDLDDTTDMEFPESVPVGPSKHQRKRALPNTFECMGKPEGCDSDSPDVENETTMLPEFPESTIGDIGGDSPVFGPLTPDNPSSEETSNTNVHETVVFIQNLLYKIHNQMESAALLLCLLFGALAGVLVSVSFLWICKRLHVPLRFTPHPVSVYLRTVEIQSCDQYPIENKDGQRDVLIPIDCDTSCNETH